MVPNSINEKHNNNFHSFMIEINKNLYVNNPKKFKLLQNQIKNFF